MAVGAVGSAAPPGSGARTSTEWRSELVLQVVTPAVALFVLRLVIAVGAPGPVVMADEPGFVGTARLLARAGAAYRMDVASHYDVLYGALLAPAALLRDPDAVWAGTMATNAVLGALLYVVLRLLAPALAGLAGWTATGAALLGASVPAVLAQTSFAWAESLASLAFAAAVGAVYLALTARRSWQRALAGPAVAMLPFVHGRFYLVTALALGLLLVALVRERNGRLAAIVLAGFGIVFLLLRVASQAVWDRRWSTGGDARTAGLLPTVGELPDLVAVLVGHTWYLVASTVGVACLGVVGLAVLVPGIRAEPASVRAARGSCAVLVLGGAGALVATSSVWFVSILDSYNKAIYGRYTEVVLPLVALGVVGGAAWVRDHRVAGAFAVLLPTALLGAGTWLTLDTSLPMNHITILGLNLYPGGGGDALLRNAVLLSTALAGVLLAVVLVAPARALLPVLIGASVVASTVTAVRLVDFQKAHYVDWDVPSRYASVVESADAVWVDFTTVEDGRLAGFAFWGYQFWFPGTDFHSFRSGAGEEPGAGIVLTGADGVPPGAQVVLEDPRWRVVGWVAEGSAGGDDGS